MSFVIRGRDETGRNNSEPTVAHRIDATIDIDAGAPSEVRAIVRETIPGDRHGEDALLLASELTTNAILHGSWLPGDVLNVSIVRRRHGLRFSVTGPGEMSWVDPRQSHPGGFGLAIVDRLSSRWGIEQLKGDQTRVWFELAW